jgi:alkanesulfonate monooxygenase
MTKNALRFHWFLPTSGDGRNVTNVVAVEGQTKHNRPPSITYMSQVALAAEAVGFEAVLTPVGSGCEDPLVLCTAVAPQTSSLRFIVAFRPTTVQPTWFAHQASTFQRLTNNRLILNVVTGGDPGEQRAFGDFSPHDERYERTDEFLDVFGRMWQEGRFDFSGKHVQVEGAGFRLPATPRPPVYFGGASSVAERIAARHADTYLMWGEPPSAICERIMRMRELVELQKRKLSLGLRLHIIARETSEAAWQEAERLLEGMDKAAIEAAQARFARMDSVGQSRMTTLHNGKYDGLEIAPNLWAGIGLVREGAGTALVGSYEEVAERLHEYAALGIDEFILSGYPHLEEAYRLGECVVPLLKNVNVSQGLAKSRVVLAK